MHLRYSVHFFFILFFSSFFLNLLLFLEMMSQFRGSTRINTPPSKRGSETERRGDFSSLSSEPIDENSAVDASSSDQIKRAGVFASKTSPGLSRPSRLARSMSGKVCLTSFACLFLGLKFFYFIYLFLLFHQKK